MTYVSTSWDGINLNSMIFCPLQDEYYKMLWNLLVLYYSYILWACLSHTVSKETIHVSEHIGVLYEFI